MNKEFLTAYNILKSVYFEKAYANIELNKFIKSDNSLNNGLITKICYGVLQNDIYLDYVLKDNIKPSTKPQVVLILKMGRYISENVSGVPSYALVNELVEITKQKFDRYVAGFVNATLKNVINKKVTFPKTGTVEYLSVKYSYPKWIIEKMLKDRGYAFVEEFLKTELTTLTHIRILGDPKTFENDLKTCDIQYIDTPLNFTKYVDYNKLLQCDIFNDRYVVQGLPSLICSLSLGVTKGSKVLDSTSAPGGKTAVIASIDPSISVTACDLHSHRVLLIEKYMKKLRIKNVTALKVDATMFNPSFEKAFDFVLCDVPCSGLGVVNKKPDILLNRTSDTLDEIVVTQKKILENNSRYVKDGGVLLYSTCSVLKEENNMVVADFLSKHPEFELTPIDTHGINVVNENNCYTFYPNVSNTEGFFIGRLRKK